MPADVIDIASVFADAAEPIADMHTWVCKNRRIVTGARQGRWDISNAPFSTEPHNAISDRRTRSVVVVAPAQLMKSELAVSAAVYSAATGRDVLFYEPSIDLLKKFMVDRVRPSLLALGEMQVQGADRDLFKKRDAMVELRTSSGGSILGLTPQMKTGKAAHTAPMVVLDEVDLFGTSTDMIQVAKQRSSSYGRDACVVALSTPTEDRPGSIWRAWQQGSMGVWRGRCSHCGDLSAMQWAQVSFDRDSAGYWLPDTATFNCSECGTEWTEAERLAAVRAGRYVHKDPDHENRTFHVPGVAHIWRSIKDIVTAGAEAWEAAQDDGDWTGYQRFVNEHRGDVWDRSETGLSATRMQSAVFDIGGADEGTLGVISEDVLLITMGADVGLDSIHAEVVGWGVDDDGRVLAHGLRYFVARGDDGETIEGESIWENFEREIQRSKWRHPAGDRPVGIQRGLVDARYRTEIVRGWLHNRMRSELKRLQRGARNPFDATLLPVHSKAFAGTNAGKRIDLIPGVKSTQSKYAKNLLPSVVWIDSAALKDDAYDALKSDRRLPSDAVPANTWPSDLLGNGFTPGYFRELASEVRMTRRTPQGRMVTEWKIKTGAGKANEAWDARIYALAAAWTQAGSRSLGDYLLKLKARATPTCKSDAKVLSFTRTAPAEEV